MSHLLHSQKLRHIGLPLNWVLDARMAIEELRNCFREPITQIWDAAKYLDAAVSAHLEGATTVARQLFVLANNQEVWNFTDSIWGAKSPYVRAQKRTRSSTSSAEKARMPSSRQKLALHERDGFHCRFCGMPVIRSEIRKKIVAAYPKEVPWGRSNRTQHAAFQAMWAQYDHVIPHSEGGSNDMDNLVVTCAPCNFGKMSYTLEELGLKDPRDRPPVQSEWDGLERFR